MENKPNITEWIVAIASLATAIATMIEVLMRD